MDEQVPVAVAVVTSIIMVGSALVVHRVGKRAGVLVIWFRDNAAIFITLTLLGALWVFVWTLLSAKQAASAAKAVSNNEAA